MESSIQHTAAADALAQQTKLLKRIYRASVLRTIACLLILVLAAGSAFSIVPRFNALLTQLNVVADSLAQADIAYMTQSVTNLAVTGAEGIEQALEQVSGAVDTLNRLDIEALNQSIADLHDIVEPLAKLFRK
ncbi:MAG: hypothetical protein LBN26_09530 [Christensenellaceae bacterium]|jgi:hypothetical protein|nr:hypothetical protein [Christensenellaceae bacterium]